MGPYEYEVASIDGDYAVLRRTDNDTHDEILVARALLPEEIDIGTALHYEMFSNFSFGLSVYVGQNFGARLYDRMKKSINVCLSISAAVTIALSAVLLAIAKPMLGLFSDDAQVIEIGLSIVYLIVPTYITYIFIEILSGAMRGAGDSLIPTIMTLTGVCLLRVFWVTVVVSAHHELKVLLMSYPITWIVTSAMFLVYYLRGKWLKRCIALQNAEN